MDARRVSFFIRCMLIGFFLFFGVSCAEVPAVVPAAPTALDPTSLPVVQFTPTVTMTPNQAITTFQNVCSLDGKQIQLEGILHLPNPYYCEDKPTPSFCVARLISAERTSNIVLRLDVQPGNLANNHMAVLPRENAKFSDFKIMGDGGELIGEADLVRITGEVGPGPTNESEEEPFTGRTKNCALAPVSKIEPITQLSSSEVDASHQADLQSALKNGWLTANISATNFSFITINLQSKSNTALEISIEPRTVFAPGNKKVEKMVNLVRQLVVLPPNNRVALTMVAVSLDMKLSQPSKTDVFQVDPQAVLPDDLISLLSNPAFRFETTRVQQLAAWTISNNPGRDGYTGITSNPKAQGDFGGKPSGKEFDYLRTLFKNSGIDTTKYTAIK